MMMKGVVAMKLELYQRVALAVDEPEFNLKKGMWRHLSIISRTQPEEKTAIYWRYLTLSANL